MATSVIAVEWLNQNSLRNYPFQEDCSLRPDDSEGDLIEDGWRIPSYFITDFVLCVNGTDYNPTMYLKRLSVIDRTATIVLADSEGSDAVTVAVMEGDRGKQVSGTGSFIDARGFISFGNLTDFFDSTPEGIMSFRIEETLIEPTCIRPSAASIRSIAITDATGYKSARLQGDINLVAGENINLNYDESTHTLQISADPHSGYSPGCICNKINNRVVRTINGISTDNVDIVGDDCVDVVVDNGIITIKDKCSKPCCGCAETAFINQTINDLQSTVTVLSSNASILSERINSFITSYLLARKNLT